MTACPDCADCLTPELISALSGWVNIAVIILIAVLSLLAAMIGVVLGFIFSREKEIRADMNNNRVNVENQLNAVFDSLDGLTGRVNELSNPKEGSSHE